MFNIKVMYCKYVIDILYKRIIKLKKLNILDEYLEEKLYSSYVELEKIISEEQSNIL